MARVLGGRTSRSGLTIDPAWVEEGALFAMRSDSLPINDVPSPLVVFEEHGTNPQLIRELDREAYIRSVEEWTSWRREYGRAQPELSLEEHYLAKRNTRDLPGAYLTRGEAMEGLLMRNSALPGAWFSVEEDLDEPETSNMRWDWEVSVPGVGNAYGFSSSKDTPPDRWGFTRDGAIIPDQGEEGWTQQREFRVILNGERFSQWMYTRWTEDGKVECSKDYGETWMTRRELYGF
jgi:hypothetical protein